MKSFAAIVLLACSMPHGAELRRLQSPPTVRRRHYERNRTWCWFQHWSEMPKGSWCISLKSDDFRVTDDGMEQKLTLDEDTGSDPLALVVAVGSGGGGRASWTAIAA